MKPKSLHERIYAVVRRIPGGRVATYGQIAELADLPGQPRLVGYALSALRPGNDVPWQRVINAKGEICLRSSGGAGDLQRSVLESEGVRFDPSGRIPLSQYQWGPGRRRRWAP
ncbi:MAG: methyltransferase [Candidatus Eisenbacteria bacterium]|nr:methyltransferase [Candidatus Eisenbacteria bacterium]